MFSNAELIILSPNILILLTLIDGGRANVKRAQGEYQRIIEALVALSARMKCLAYVNLLDKVSDLVRQPASYAKYNALGGVKSFSDIESAEKWIEGQLTN